MSMIKDQNMRFIILQKLWDTNDLVANEINKIVDSNFKDLIFEEPAKYEWYDKIPEVITALENIEILPEYLLEIEELDGSAEIEIFSLVMPNWDGEGDEFSLLTVQDIDLMPNLKYMYGFDFSLTFDQEKLITANLIEIGDRGGLTAEVKKELIKKGTIVTDL